MLYYILVRSSEETTAKDTIQTIDMRTDPLITAVSVNEHEDDIVLRPEQHRLLEEFRRTLRSYKTDDDRFQVCADLRDNLLAENAALQYFAAEVETIMFEECKEYKERKLRGWSDRTGESETDAEKWKRFVGVAREGRDAIRNCLHPLRKAGAAWGKEKLQHYEWAYKGLKYCKVLGTASSQVPEWEEAVIKLNQLIKRRTTMVGRRSLRASVNPIDQTDLENLKRWTDKHSYIKMNDREEVHLEYRQLTVEDLAEEYGFDKFGLIVQREFAAIVRARATTLPTEDRPAGSAIPMTPPADNFGSLCESANQESASAEQPKDMAPLTVERLKVIDTSSVILDEDVIVRPRLDTTTDTSRESYGEAVDPLEDISASNASGIHSAAVSSVNPPISDILSPATSDITNPAISVIDTDHPSGEAPKSDDASRNGDPSTAKVSLASGTEHTYLRTSTRIRSAPKPYYQDHSTTRSQTRSKRHTVPPELKDITNGETPGAQCQCSAELPEVFLQMLERGPESITPDAGSLLVQKLADYKDDLCLRHSKRLINWALAAMPQATKAALAADPPSRHTHFNCAPSRRRSSSVPDIMHDLPPTKKRRLAASSPLFMSVEERAKAQDQRIARIPGPNKDDARASYNLAGDAEFRQQVLNQLGERIRLKVAKPDSWEEMNDTAMFQLVSSATQPNLGGEDDEVDAYFLSSEEAAARIECTERQLRVPIITYNQQQFRWTRGAGRPIEQFFRRMEGLDQMVSVQIPSLSIHGPSFSQMRLSVVKERFLSDDFTNDRWNLLDLGCSLPGILPNFLIGENCQLLPTIRNEALRGDTFDRTLASCKQWNEWKDIEHWALLAQSGALTLRHQDSHGFATWITGQEGLIGVGWMSRPTVEESRAWMANPVNYTGGKLRYIVLAPGQTILIPSGVDHFVFRLIGQNLDTLALGGHILLWSWLDVWMEVVLDQLRHPAITNEEMRATIPKYVDIVVKLVSQRKKCGRVKELGGEERVSRFFALVEVCTELVDIAVVARANA